MCPWLRRLQETQPPVPCISTQVPPPASAFSASIFFSAFSHLYKFKLQSCIVLGRTLRRSQPRVSNPAPGRGQPAKQRLGTELRPPAQHQSFPLVPFPRPPAPPPSEGQLQTPPESRPSARPLLSTTSTPSTISRNRPPNSPSPFLTESSKQNFRYIHVPRTRLCPEHRILASCHPAITHAEPHPSAPKWRCSARSHSTRFAPWTSHRAPLPPSHVDRKPTRHSFSPFPVLRRGKPPSDLEEGTEVSIAVRLPSRWSPSKWL